MVMDIVEIGSQSALPSQTIATTFTPEVIDRRQSKREVPSDGRAHACLVALSNTWEKGINTELAMRLIPP
jgi:hypothetical protein